MAGTARVEVVRGGEVESRHEVVFAWRDTQIPADRGERVFLRSAAKPFQAAAVVASGAIARLGEGDETLAILAASHSGEDRHTALVARLLARLGLDESALRCGAHPPFDAETASRVGARATALHNNCSGKHTGMLALALELGTDPARYLDPDGPVQRLMRDAVAAVCGLAPEELVTAIDGCGALTFAVPLGHAARAFALLARPADAPGALRAPLAQIAAAMARRPELVAGEGRLDTRLMRAAGGRLIAKGGAEGVQGVADPARGFGFFLKVRDGASRAVGPATVEALAVAGSLAAGVLAAIEDVRRPTLANHSGTVVGQIRAKVTRRDDGA